MRELLSNSVAPISGVICVVLLRVIVDLRMAQAMLQVTAQTLTRHIFHPIQSFVPSSCCRSFDAPGHP